MFAFGLSFYLIVMKEAGSLVQVVNSMKSGALVLIVQLVALLPCCIFLKKSNVIQLLK